MNIEYQIIIELPNINKMKSPEYRFIISFITSENRFLYMNEITDYLSKISFKEKASLQLYVKNTLRKLTYSGQLICYKRNNQSLWGLIVWTDKTGKPLRSHEPKKLLEGKHNKPFGFNTSSKI